MIHRRRPRPGSTPKLGEHTFDPYKAKDCPPDHKGRLVCRRCQAVGEPGDQRHFADEATVPVPPAAPPAVAAARAEYDAAILGESGDD